MSKIYINNKKYYASESDNLLQVCLSNGLDIPYFCWHPELGSVGSCRQCAVTQYNSLSDSQGRLVMSCMTPVVDGIIISTNDHMSKTFRKNIVELLLTNHPHDCPVCEEGGNCHLQDMTVMNKHYIRNYRFSKRTHKNQYLGPFIKHEMNRCIGCYRCIRYYKDYADGTDLNVYGANNNLYFGRIEDGVLENEHSGNLIEICPTGVFTDKIHSIQYNRKWDMQYAPSICQNCSVGCNISIGERYGEIRRIENRYHQNINNYFICDLGRFGYSHNSLKRRPRNPSYIANGKLNILNFNDAIKKGVNFLQRYKNIIGIGSTRASIENNFALQELVGEKNFSHGMSIKEASCVKLILNVFENNELYIPSLKEIESYDVIVILGEDVTQTSPRIALSVRQAMKNKAKKIAELNGIPKWNATIISSISENHKNSLYITHTHETKLDDISDWSYFASINDQSKFGSAIAHVLDSKSLFAQDFSPFLLEKASLIAKKIFNAKKVLIISGTSSFSTSIIKTAINLAISIKKKKVNHVALTFLTSSSNTLGVGLIGGISIEQAVQRLNQKEADAIIFMEYDLYRYLSKYDCDIFLKNRNNVLSIDHQYTKTYTNSNLSLPCVNFSESSGTIINFEGRAQRFFQVYDPMFIDKKNCLYESWKWLHFIQCKFLNKKISWLNLDDIIVSYSNKYPIFKKILKFLPHSDFRINNQKIARSPNRYSGRTALQSHINIHESSQPEDVNTMFSFSMEGFNQPNKSFSYIPFAWFPGWNSPQAWNKFQVEVGKQLIAEESGVHLFKDNKKNTDIYFPYINTIKKKYWYIIPYYHIFGNEELTQNSSVIQKNTPLPYVLLSNLDALEIGLKKDSIVEFNCLNKNFRLNIRLSKNLYKKQIGLPIGRKGFPIALVGKEIKYIREFIK
ncbi:NADH-quinone oxidoreductase subunit NuoG [Buchnera aphidicola (Aphis helianthi)]|uniref:NADH-quinone oxidoreductase n=1 Tax=Buchnera aphidicola (Aphis helianthi) TaxID=2315802 RepID=A0A4D6XN79_9GAMM|nr:NADH-quinone oxidoreductase subunit NuoG [Buchnera aphidicola]QCI16989.1 NADH-quinone oxidoreductase subunit NuoG [Buchnera aphidicola (Aphis helianthi)]